MNIAHAKVIAEAWQEMNVIRARDGVPYSRDGMQSGVTQEYWDSILTRLDALLRAETGHGAHCHPALYGQA